MENLQTYLEDIESRLIAEQEERLLGECETFARGEWTEEYFNPARTTAAPSKLDWPDININDAIEDDELMIISQFTNVSRMIGSNEGRLLTVRSNYGVGILPSLFEVEKFIMPFEHNTLPNVRPFKGGVKDIRRVVDGPLPDLNAGFGKDVFRLGKRYEEIYSQFPNIAKYVRTDHPDCQGPMDICELLWGSEIFTALYDMPDLIHGLLRKVTETYKVFLGEWFKANPDKDELHAYFGQAHLGSICVRDDSAMNISPEMCREYIFPYDQEILSHFGGGSIHFCGKADHYVQYFADMNGLEAMNMSQPEYNDMESIFSATVDKGLPIYGLPQAAIDEALTAKRPLRGLVHSGS